MKILQRLITPALAALFLMTGACTTRSLTPEQAKEKLVGVWKMDMTEQYERYITDYVNKTESQPEADQLQTGRPRPKLRMSSRDTEQTENAVSPKMTNDEMLEILLSRNVWYEFQGDGTLKLTATQMGEKETDEAKWELVDTIDNKVTILLHTEPESGPHEIEFLSNDQIQLKMLPPPDADKDEMIEFQNSSIIFDREIQTAG